MSQTSGTSAASDESATNNPAPVSQTSGTSAASDESATISVQQPHIEVLKGNPTDEELAALIAVLAGASGGPGESGPAERNMWGHPVDKLRFPLISWQRVTLLERTHTRR